MKVLIVVNVEWYFWSHRLPLARALRTAGYEVVVVAAEERDERGKIEAAGFRFVPLRLSRGSTNAAREFATFLDLARIYRRERPTVVHHVSIKPVLYGSIAARLLRVPFIVNAVTGLGYAFSPATSGSLLRQLTVRLYRLACGGRHTHVICQNPDDQAALSRLGIATPDRMRLIRGSGVDIQTFRPTPESPGPPLVVMAGRLLWDKGVGEFVEAVRRLRANGLAFRAALVGVPDAENPQAVPVEQLTTWRDQGVVEWWGLREDMPEVLAQSALVVLPTYYPEGVPKVLIEAAASSRAIVATDVPGCREIARHDVNALLVRPRDAAALAAAVERLLLDPALRESFGRAGRDIAVREFSEECVLRDTLAMYRDLTGDPPA